MNIELPKLSGGVISAEASGDAGVVRVRFSGTADLEATQQYRIHLLSNPNLLWQRRSLAALSCFAVDLVAIET